MTITVASWNIRDGIMNPSVRAHILSLGADVVVLPEAYAEADHGSAALREVLRHLKATSPYEVHRTLYGDDDGRVDRHGLVVLVRNTLPAYAQIIDVGRKMIKVRIGNLLIVAVHFDDRRDATRLQQFARLQPHISHGEVEHVALVGDFNATYPSTWLSWFMEWLPFDWLPVGEPGTRQSKLARAGSLFTRLREMTHSPLMEELVRLRFKDADSKWQPTMLLLRKVPLAQLDHIMVRDVEVVSFHRLMLAGSDHLPIVAELEVP